MYQGLHPVFVRIFSLCDLPWDATVYCELIQNCVWDCGDVCVKYPLSKNRLFSKQKLTDCTTFEALPEALLAALQVTVQILRRDKCLIKP